MVGVMTGTVVDRGVSQAEDLLHRVDGRVERVDSELSARSDNEIVGLVTELEMLSRRVGALSLAVMDVVQPATAEITLRVLINPRSVCTPATAPSRISMSVTAVC